MPDARRPHHPPHRTRPGQGPIRVVLDGDLPVRVDLGDGRVRRVAAVLDAWRVGNRWWRDEPPSTHLLVDLIDDAPEERPHAPSRRRAGAPSPRDADRATATPPVATPPVVTAELYRQAGVWRLERILD